MKKIKFFKWSVIVFFLLILIANIIYSTYIIIDHHKPTIIPISKEEFIEYVSLERKNNLFPIVVSKKFGANRII